jgi:signal transduction histidine kinase
MESANAVGGTEAEVLQKTEEYFLADRDAIYCRTDRLFGFLMITQWLLGIFAAFVVSPRSWVGDESVVHQHVWTAIFLGGTISLFPAFLAFRRPGRSFTRHTIVAAQMLTSGLLIHLSGGRIETHFHIFGSLALIAFYADWSLFVTATLITTLNHVIGGFYFPLSMYGVAYVSIWRSVEHAGWVLFENAFLVWSCRANISDGREVARKRAELEATNSRLQEQTQQLLQAQKLESIGQLAAGIAHEINTPIQFVGDNTRFIQDEFKNISTLLTGCSKLIEALNTNSPTAEAAKEIEEISKQVDSEYLCDEIPKALQQSLDGIARVTRIVRAMKEFSHPGSTDKQVIDLNRTIESTIVVSTNEWKYVAEVQMDFDKSLPLVPCLPGEFNQVILNLLVNSAHALAEVKDRGVTGKGKITISTRQVGDWAEIRMHDTGSGIPKEIAHKIFDPFFTTKEVGKGTGQGLSIARSIIVKKHGGTMEFESEPGKGTTFILRLPIKENPSTPAPGADAAGASVESHL